MLLPLRRAVSTPVEVDRALQGMMGLTLFDPICTRRCKSMSLSQSSMKIERSRRRPGVDLSPRRVDLVSRLWSL